MTTTVGIFVERQTDPQVLWNQCDEPEGRHGDLQLVGQDADADHVLVIGTPFRPGPDPKLGRWQRMAAYLRNDRRRRKLDAAWSTLGARREQTTVLFYEPSPLVHVDYASARTHAARVFGTDDRAPEPIVLPTFWQIDDHAPRLRPERPPVADTVALSIVTSGRMVVPGHARRLGFLERLREAGVPFDLFGRGLPDHLGGRGPIQSKGTALRPARYVLSLENHDGGDCYVTEKLWDPLLTWSLPLYYGSAAADRVVPSEAFIRLPDLEDRGVETVREALAHPEWWEQRLEAMGEARRRILGEQRMVEWIRRSLLSR